MASVMGLASHCGSDLGMVVAESFVVQVLWVVVQYAVQILDKVVFQVLWVVFQVAVQIRDKVVVSNVACCGSSCRSYVGKVVLTSVVGRGSSVAGRGSKVVG